MGTTAVGNVARNSRRFMVHSVQKSNWLHALRRCHRNGRWTARSVPVLHRPAWARPRGPGDCIELPTQSSHRDRRHSSALETDSDGAGGKVVRRRPPGRVGIEELPPQPAALDLRDQQGRMLDEILARLRYGEGGEDALRLRPLDPVPARADIHPAVSRLPGLVFPETLMAEDHDV